ncbi:hypothetical protein BDR05DRAFT_223575 [Suillus weaverae]|nr:hypothetical protein BDR05DRAFT_223575 [Suillus weaverae]
MEPGLECTWSRIRYVQERDTKDCFGWCVMGATLLSSLQLRLPYPTCQRHATELPRMIHLSHTSTRSVTIFAMLLTVVILKVQVMFKAIRSKLTYVGGIIAKTWSVVEHASAFLTILQFAGLSLISMFDPPRGLLGIPIRRFNWFNPVLFCL